MRLATNVHKLLTHVIWFFGKHATIEVPTIAEEMVGWLVIGGLLQETSTGEEDPTIDRELPRGCLLGPRSWASFQDQRCFYSAPIPSFLLGSMVFSIISW